MFEYIPLIYLSTQNVILDHIFLPPTHEEERFASRWRRSLVLAYNLYRLAVCMKKR